MSYASNGLQLGSRVQELVELGVLSAMVAAHGSVVDAAALLQVSRYTVYRILKRYNARMFAKAQADGYAADHAWSVESD